MRSYFVDSNATVYSRVHTHMRQRKENRTESLTVQCIFPFNLPLRRRYYCRFIETQKNKLADYRLESYVILVRVIVNTCFMCDNIHHWKFSSNFMSIFMDNKNLTTPSVFPRRAFTCQHTSVDAAIIFRRIWRCFHDHISVIVHTCIVWQITLEII